MTRNVIVTGAASGIGRGIATAAVARGDSVFLLDLDVGGVAAVGAELGAAGSAACDVSDPELVESTIAVAFEVLGEVDLVVHAAGVSVGGPVLDATPADLRFVTNVNVLGTMFVAGSAGRRLVRQDRPSRMVFVGSEHSLGVPHVKSPAYTASKHAVLGYADVLRRELPDHVGVSVLCPGLVNTDLWRSGERRGAAYGGPRKVRPGMGKVMKAGMSTTEIAERLRAGLEAGEFLIPTHGFSRNHAALRAREVEGRSTGRRRTQPTTSTTSAGSCRRWRRTRSRSSVADRLEHAAHSHHVRPLPLGEREFRDPQVVPAGNVGMRVRATTGQTDGRGRPRGPTYPQQQRQSRLAPGRRVRTQEGAGAQGAAAALAKRIGRAVAIDDHKSNLITHTAGAGT